MATTSSLQVQEKICRYRKNCRALSLGSNRYVRAWVPRTGFQACLASEAAHGPLNVCHTCGTTKRTAADRGNGGGGGCGRAPLHHLARRRRLPTCTAAAAAGVSSGSIDSDWKWHEPILDGSLSGSDRAVLALARAAAALADKSLAHQAATAHGLAVVTSSDECVGPLLPPFGSTLEDDGEEGDGMAPPPPPSAREAVRREVGGGGGGKMTSGMAGAASSWLSTVFPSSAGAAAAAAASGIVRGSRTAPAGAAEAATTARSSPSVSPASQTMAAGAVAAAGTRRVAPPPDVQLRNLALVVAEGGGGDEDEGEDDDVRQAFANLTSGGAIGGRGGGEGAGGMMGAAAAALTRVARAAAASAADVPSAAPIGRAAAGAASAAAHAAHAAVATAVKATAQMLPSYGEPTSSWLVADDTAGGVRYIVIAAGPDLRRRTPRELTTDLVSFETYNLGAKVNKRLYGEASALYGRFMPLVMDYLEAVPHGNICFGGQGVGGALAVLLQLMCTHRGLRFARLLPAVAVDAPAVLAQVPREQRRLWGPAGREQQRPLSQDSVEDVLEDLMQRSVLEELGLPQDAVRNLVLPPPPTAPSTRPPASPPRPSLLSPLPLLSAWHGAGQQQPQQQSDPVRTSTGPMLVLGTAAAAVGDGGNGGGGAVTASPACPQVFRLVGKVVHVETIGSWRNKAALTPATAPTALAVDAVLETDGGSGELTVAAAAAAPSAGGSSGGGFGAAHKRLDVAMVGSIATAAASAAASAAVDRLRHVSTSAFRTVAAADKSGRMVAAAAAPLAAMAAAAEDEEDSDVYGV